MYYVVANFVKVLIFYKISTNGSTLFKIGVDSEGFFSQFHHWICIIRPFWVLLICTVACIRVLGRKEGMGVASLPTA